MGLTVKVSKTRNASARELSRRTGDLLDEIEDQGIGVVVVRFGRPAAFARLELDGLAWSSCIRAGDGSPLKASVWPPP